jgi:cytochrome c biogenesis protein CcdA
MTALVLAFGAGVLAALNPCAFAMLPSFAGYFVASETATGPERSADALERVLRALGVAGVVGLGVLLVFSAAGGVILAGFAAFGRILPWLALALGAALVGFGVALALGLHVPGLRLTGPAARKARGLRPMFTFGVAYGLASLSCVLPVFLVAAGVAAGQPLTDRLLSFAGFGAGLVAVLVLVSVAAALVEGVAGAARQVVRWVPLASGALLVLAGLYVIHRQFPEAVVSAGHRLPSKELTLAVTGLVALVAGGAPLLIRARRSAPTVHDPPAGTADPDEACCPGQAASPRTGVER